MLGTGERMVLHHPPPAFILAFRIRNTPANGIHTNGLNCLNEGLRSSFANEKRKGFATFLGQRETFLGAEVLKTVTLRGKFKFKFERNFTKM
jgi:hypothetical protein